MEVARVKMGILEYYFEYETLEDIKKHFYKSGMYSIGLDTMDHYDGASKGKRISVEDLTLEHLNWVNESCSWGDRFLRGWGNKII